MRLDDFPRVRLADVPTALDEAPRLAAAIGVERLLIKRDDTTGLALGGNKARKLEFLLAEAQGAGTDVVITCGGVQSNHVRMTAAAARKLGMDAVLVIPDPKPERYEGNLLLDTILGAEMRFMPGVSFLGLQRTMDTVADELRRAGRVPYVIPIGGSTPLGSFGYVNAIREVAGQLAEIDALNPDIVVALGTGGTLAGTTVGTHLFLPDARPIGVSVVLPEPRMRPNVERILAQASELAGVDPAPDPSRFAIYDQYIGEAYGVPTAGAMDAIYLTARTEGIILDPVYTGKAMAGLIDLARRGEIGKDRPILFIHTGGAPALFAYERLFRDEAVGLSLEGAAG